ncbi:hypothetical protein V6N13_055122 [Hibiscus sabdariffa]
MGKRCCPMERVLRTTIDKWGDGNRSGTGRHGASKLGAAGGRLVRAQQAGTTGARTNAGVGIWDHGGCFTGYCGDHGCNKQASWHRVLADLGVGSGSIYPALCAGPTMG